MTDRSPIAALLKRWSGLRDRASLVAARELEAAIAAQVEAERWVPVGERLPEIADPVTGYSRDLLLFTADNAQCVGFWRLDGGWLAYDDDADETEVTHWRPLPEGPKP